MQGHWVNRRDRLAQHLGAQLHSQRFEVLSHLAVN
jgi:hypothetical protein